MGKMHADELDIESSTRVNRNAGVPASYGYRPPPKMRQCAVTRRSWLRDRHL